MVPAPVKTLLRTLRVDRFFFLFFHNKYDLELSFQREWVKEFKENRSKVLEYWKTYRYLDRITTVCEIREDTMVLDVGCGISTVLHYIKGQKFGIDPLANEYLKLYEYPEGITIKKGFGERIPFPDECFDVVFCSNVLDHVTSPSKTVDEIHRVLKTSGHLALTVEVFEEKTERGPGHPHSLTKRSVHSLLEGGFKTMFEKESPAILLRRYVNGSRKSCRKELITTLKKI